MQQPNFHQQEDLTIPNKNIREQFIKNNDWEIVEVPSAVVYKIVNRKTGQILNDWSEVVDFLNSDDK